MADLHQIKIKGYGWKRQLPDVRDHQFKVERLGSPRPHSDLRWLFPAPYNQLQLGSCTGNGIAGALQADQKKQGLPIVTPSRLFIYYGERVIEGTVNEDAGAEIRDGIKVVAQQGAPPETVWPYSDANPGPFQTQPTAAVYVEAAKHKAIQYEAVPQDATSLKAVLSSGFPVVFGFTVYESFESEDVASTGHVQMPQPGEQIVGGHCVVLIGHDDPRGVFYCRNSWGPDWGWGGYFSIPYAYLTNPDLASDFWVVQHIS